MFSVVAGMFLWENPAPLHVIPPADTSILHRTLEIRRYLASTTAQPSASLVPLRDFTERERVRVRIDVSAGGRM